MDFVIFNMYFCFTVLYHVFSLPFFTVHQNFHLEITATMHHLFQFKSNYKYYTSLFTC